MFQLTLVHVEATAKNAADNKIIELMTQFGDIHPFGSKVVLISSTNICFNEVKLPTHNKLDVLNIRRYNMLCIVLYSQIVFTGKCEYAP